MNRHDAQYPVVFQHSHTAKPSTAVFVDNVSEPLDETIVDDWVRRVVHEIHVQQLRCTVHNDKVQNEACDDKQHKDGGVDLQRLHVHGTPLAVFVSRRLIGKSLTGSGHSGYWSGCLWINDTGFLS